MSGMYFDRALIDRLAKDIIDKYLKGGGSINDMVEKMTNDFKEALLRVLNGFDVKEADMQSGEMAWCPVDPTKIKVRLFRNICQDWQNVPECFHGLCGFFPVFDKNPVTNMRLNPKKSFVDVDLDSFITELEKKGVTSFAEKVRYLRNSFIDTLGVEGVREMIKKMFNMSGGKKLSFDNFKGDVDSWKVDLYDSFKNKNMKNVEFGIFTKGAEVRSFGVIKEVKEFDDGSYLFVVNVDGVDRVVLPEHVINIFE